MKSLIASLAVALLVTGCGESKVVVDQLKQENADQKTEIALLKSKIAQLEPLAAKARTIPVRIATRGALTGNGTVYQIVNVSSSPMPVKIKLSNPTYQRSQAFTPLLPAPSLPAPPFEIGHAEGWPGSPGDVLEISSEGYDVLIKKF